MSWVRKKNELHKLRTIVLYSQLGFSNVNFTINIMKPTHFIYTSMYLCTFFWSPDKGAQGRVAELQPFVLKSGREKSQVSPSSVCSCSQESEHTVPVSATPKLRL